jgi:hypothetical protein
MTEEKKIPDNNNKVKPAEAEAMFKYWCQVQNLRAVAEKFHRQYSTVHRTKKRWNWDSRFTEIKTKVQKESEKQAEQAILQNIDYVRALKNKVLKQLLATDKSGNQKPIKADIGDAIKLMQYEDELTGLRPHDNDIIKLIVELKEQGRQGELADDFDTVLNAIRQESSH